MTAATNMAQHDYEHLTTFGADFKQLCFVGAVAHAHNRVGGFARN